MNERLRSELLEDSADRAAFYGLLSSIYLVELTEDQVQSFAEQDFSSFKGSSEVIDRGIGAIEHYFHTPRIANMREELASDYAHSILGVTADQRKMALPYESYFTSENELLMQDARDDVYRLYCEEGLGTPEGLDIPEDHLGLMFEFMAHLCERYNTALGGCDISEARRLIVLQGEVLGNHLSNWMDDYCNTLESVSRTDFYRGVALITRGWVDLDAAIVSNMIIDTGDIEG
jgi:TorA maturation chaperone TorD